MTAREAIARFEPYIWNECYRKEFQEACAHAISALKEREERSKGCEFCDGTERSMMFRKGECAAMSDEVYVSGDAIIIDYGCKAYDTVKIGFCPMCGRPLKGEDND